MCYLVFYAKFNKYVQKMVCGKILTLLLCNNITRVMMKSVVERCLSRLKNVTNHAEQRCQSKNTKKSRVLLIGKYYGTIQFNHVKNFLLENALHAARNSAVRKDRTQSGHSFFLYKIGGTVLRLA